MKRILVIVAVAAVMMSCIAVKNSSANEKANTAAKTFIVPQSQWLYGDDADHLNGYFYSPQTWSKLDASVLGNAVVVAYLKVNGRYQQLPYTIYREDTDGAQWAEHVDYDFKENNITFYVTYSDFYYEVADIAPIGMEFRVVIMW